MTAMATVYDDLDWLRENGALAGVAEIIRERRRQIESKSYSVAHDRVHHADGGLPGMVVKNSAEAFGHALAGLYGPPEVERQMAKAGAVAAAEIDRLLAEGY